MKNSIRERAKLVPTDIKSMVNKSMSTARRIMSILDKKNMNQKDLAELLDKKESEISKWLQGTHNFTYRTICKIEEVLGEEIVLISDNAIPITYQLSMDSLKAAAHSYDGKISPKWMSSFKDSKLILGSGRDPESCIYDDSLKATCN